MTTVRTKVRTVLSEKKVESIVGRKWVGEVEDAFPDSDHFGVRAHGPLAENVQHSVPYSTTEVTIADSGV